MEKNLSEANASMERRTYPWIERPVRAQTQIALPCPALALACPHIPFRGFQLRIALRDLRREPAFRGPPEVLRLEVQGIGIGINSAQYEVKGRNDTVLWVGQVVVVTTQMLPGRYISRACC